MAIEEATLTVAQQNYLDWLCTAPSERVPASKAKYAIEHQVDETTLRRWQKKEVFVNEWKKRVDDIQGSKLKMAVTTKPSKLKPGSKAAKRRKSFCARMGGMPGPMKDSKGRPTRKALALRKWNC